MPIKVELHSHTSDDPFDAIPYSTWDLIDRASALGYGALAITLHDKQLDVAPLREYAFERGIVLIPGIERTIQGKHVLLINFANGGAHVTRFDQLADLKRHDRGLVIAPHPFYPWPACMGSMMDRHADLVDAVEIHGMYAPGANFNTAAMRWAARHGKPVVGNGDVHRLSQLGTTYSLVAADANAESICEAIRAGRVEVRTEPLTWLRTTTLLGELFSVAAVRYCSGVRAKRSAARTRDSVRCRTEGAEPPAPQGAKREQTGRM